VTYIKLKIKQGGTIKLLYVVELVLALQP